MKKAMVVMMTLIMFALIFLGYKTEARINHQQCIREEFSETTAEALAVTEVEAVIKIEETESESEILKKIDSMVVRAKFLVKPILLETTAETETEAETEAEPEKENLRSKYFSSRDDYERLCMLTHAESGLEDFEGRVAVAAVIINRLEDSEFPDTFWEVMTERNQFSSVKNGKIFICGEEITFEDVTQETIDAVERALGGEDPTEELLSNKARQKGEDVIEYAEGGALYFYNPEPLKRKALSERANIKVKIAIDHHIFYKVWDE